LRGKGKAKPSRTTSPIVRELIDALVLRGLSQESVAQAIGVSGAALSYWKSGVSRPNLVTTEAFAQVMGYKLALVPIEEK